MISTIESIYHRLLSHHGHPRWWPAKTPYEVVVGAVLTQNTAWGNVEKAIANFGDAHDLSLSPQSIPLSPEAILSADLPDLAAVIRPAGYFNQKAVYLKTVTEWFAKYDFDAAAVRREPLEKLRGELLATKGVGPETADSILLYAFDFPTFVVDAYTVRFCDRYPIDAGKGYAVVKAYFEANLPRSVEVYNNFHALIVINGAKHCRKKALCEGCPLGVECGRVG
ncbi:MAG: endonuclease III domain-containing protein [Chitinispirillales bacterium]|jgi:endonuclease-3 related protein|nr:endonuclease III domain-containing protein [Chitinispirillales bacterium]